MCFIGALDGGTRIRHGKNSEGYVLSAADGAMKCLFGKQAKTLLYSLVIGSEMAEVLGDRRLGCRPA